MQRIFIEASVLTSSHVSGIAKSLLRTLEAFDESEKKQCTLIAPIGSAQKLHGLGLHMPIRTIPIPNPLFRVLKKYDLLPPLDLFFGRGVYLFPNFWNTPLIRSKSMTYIYDMSFLIYPELVEEKNQKYLSSMISKWCSRTDVILTISDQVKSEIISIMGKLPHEIVVNHLGVDRDMFSIHQVQDIDRVMKKYGIETTGYFLIVGNIEPRKNIDTVLEAYAKLPTDIASHHHLVIIGAGGWKNEHIISSIDQHRREGKNIQYIAKKVPDTDLSALYASAVSGIQASHYEGFGMTPLEALASGSRCIVSDIPVSREVYGDDESIIYVNPSDSMDIARAMEHVCTLSKRPTPSLLLDRYRWRDTAARLLATARATNED